jgi:dihydroorotate dehydrogenase (fumarate)
MTLATSYLGLDLAHPFMLGASPLTGHVDNIRRLEDAGCAAIVMHSLFAEQIGEPAAGQIAALQRAASDLSATSAHFPRPARFPLEPHEYLEQIRRIRAAVAIPVIGSLNAAEPNGWMSFAPLIQDAGADALELNAYYVGTDIQTSAAEIEGGIESLVRSLKEMLRIPVAVKLMPYYTSFGRFAARLDQAGADGLVLFNRFYHSDIDVETLEVLPNLRLSTSAELPLRLHWLEVLSGRVKASLAVTGGVHTVLDGVKALLSGANAAQMVSAVLQQGPEHFKTMQEGLRSWMTRHQLESIEGFRSRANLVRCTSPAEFERTNYRRVLEEWTS